MENIPCGSCGRPTELCTLRCAGCEIQYLLSNPGAVNLDTRADARNADICRAFCAAVELLGFTLPEGFAQALGYQVFRYLADDEPAYMGLYNEDGSVPPALAVAHYWFAECSAEMRTSEDVRQLAAHSSYGWCLGYYDSYGEDDENYERYLGAVRMWLGMWLECQDPIAA
jgi:hypothetical protein